MSMMAMTMVIVTCPGYSPNGDSDQVVRGSGTALGNLQPSEIELEMHLQCVDKARLDVCNTRCLLRQSVMMAECCLVTEAWAVTML
jgi:hypothetical protein